VLGLLALGGCSSSEPSSAEQAALAKTELHFSLDQCQPLDANLYKCPASDKPICNPDYNGQVECVRVGPKGSVFVQSGTPQQPYDELDDVTLRPRSHTWDHI
jgi:hypothetical protein